MLKFFIQGRISQERIDLKTSFYICWEPNKILISGGMLQQILTLRMDREGINWGFSIGSYEIRKMGHRFTAFPSFFVSLIFSLRRTA
jgi:hypothetical protein